MTGLCSPSGSGRAPAGARRTSAIAARRGFCNVNGGSKRSLQHPIVSELSMTNSFHSRRPQAVDGQVRALPSHDEDAVYRFAKHVVTQESTVAPGRDGVTGGGWSLVVVSTPRGRLSAAPVPVRGRARPTRQEWLNRRLRPAAAEKPGGGCGRCPVAVGIPVVCHRATPPGGGAFTRVSGGLRRRPSSRCVRRRRSLAWAGEKTGPGPLQPGLGDVTMMTPSVRT
jgi:hypothetical protein